MVIDELVYRVLLNLKASYKRNTADCVDSAFVYIYNYTYRPRLNINRLAVFDAQKSYKTQ